MSNGEGGGVPGGPTQTHSISNCRVLVGPYARMYRYFRKKKKEGENRLKSMVKSFPVIGNFIIFLFGGKIS